MVSYGHGNVSFKTKQKHTCRYEKVKFIHDVHDNVHYKWIEQDCYIYKKTNKNGKDKNIVILHLKNKKYKKN
jgi:hypothetical protein